MIPRTMPRVHGADEQVTVPMDLVRWVRLAEHVLDAERVPGDVEMALVFVDVATVTDLNSRYLGGSGPTDVLAFPLEDEIPVGRSPDRGGRGPGSGPDRDEPPLAIGDVVVCPAVARDQAAQRSVDLDDELALLVVHGTLHLLGYDHAEPSDAARMHRREQDLLGSFTHPSVPSVNTTAATTRDGGEPL